MTQRVFNRRRSGHGPAHPRLITSTESIGTTERQHDHEGNVTRRVRPTKGLVILLSVCVKVGCVNLEKNNSKLAFEKESTTHQSDAEGRGGGGGMKERAGERQ